jgi:hypothetical protein
MIAVAVAAVSRVNNASSRGLAESGSVMSTTGPGVFLKLPYHSASTVAACTVLAWP